jgi:hypothetical protein
MTHESVQFLFVMLTCSFLKCEKRNGKENEMNSHEN